MCLVFLYSIEIMKTITHVSDTAFWVARFRAVESKRKDALFKDPFAEILTAKKGQEIVEHVSGAHYVAWTIVMRTKVIDEMIESLIAEGVDTIINLGAGLDTRPYRLKLPQTLRWIEVDYPHLMAFKEETLKNEKPICQLERISLDLANREERQKLFSQINSQTTKAVILTEGVIPYLTEEQVSAIAIDLHSQSNFRFWIAEYHSPMMYKNLRNVKKKREMENAPFQFFPEQWLPFFNRLSWKEKNIRYLVEDAEKWGRDFPVPWWARLLHKIMPAKEIENFRKMVGFVIFER